MGGERHHRMSDIIKLIPKDEQKGPKPDPEVIERLEDLLARAKTGEIDGLAYVVTGTPGNFGTGWTCDSPIRDRLGLGIQVLQHRYIKGVIEGT